MDGGELQSMVMHSARWLCAVVLDESEGGKHGAVAYRFDKELAVEQGAIVGAGLKSLKI